MVNSSRVCSLVFIVMMPSIFIIKPSNKKKACRKTNNNVEERAPSRYLKDHIHVTLEVH